MRRVSTNVLIALSAVGLWVGCSRSGPNVGGSGSPVPGNVIIGQWQIRSAEGRGPSLVMSIDSVAGGVLFGHVLRYMSGDMGRGPGSFLPFEASETPEGKIEITIQWANSPSPATVLTLQRDEERMRVSGFELGGDDMTAAGGIWTATRVSTGG